MTTMTFRDAGVDEQAVMNPIVRLVPSHIATAFGVVCLSVGCAIAAPPVSAVETPATMLWLGGEAPAKSGRPSRADVVRAARAALAEHAKALGVDPYKLPEPATVSIGTPSANIVTFRQRIDGIEVHGKRITVALDDAPAARAVTGDFSRRAGTVADTAFKLNAATALATLLVEGGTPELERQKDKNGYQYFSVTSKTFRATGPARLKPVWFETEGRLVAAWYVELAGRRGDAQEIEACGCLVSAEDGRVLARRSLIQEAAHTYRVYADTSGKPLTDAFGNTLPHPAAISDGWLPTGPAPMPLITLDHAGISTGDPWLPSGTTHTVGNNVDAFFNSIIADGGVWGGAGWGRAFNAADGDFRAPLSSAGHFDYSYDPGATAGDYFQIYGEPAAPVPVTSPQLNAKIVQAFYAANWLHDLFYDLGFDEAAGNMQQDNDGRGGMAGDPLLVHAGYAATFAYSPADGESPSITLGLNGVSGSRRDPSGFDFPVLVHEWTHVMHGRLTDNTTNQGQQSALNEGTADFVGVLLAVREADRDAAPGGLFNGAYGIGAYFNLDYDNPDDGCRRQERRAIRTTPISTAFGAIPTPPIFH